MMLDPANRKVHERRVVIVLQLGVLFFILAGLFSTLLFPAVKSQKAEVIDLDSVTVTKELPEEISTEEVKVRAKSAYVWDVKGNKALYKKNESQALPLASITKLMTTMLAYELISNDVEGTITASALSQDGSTGLTEGERLSLKNLSRLALISSSNDAAFALAANVGASLGKKDPAAQFISGMNIRADELGLKTLQFKNPTGLDMSLTEPGAVGSAEDVSRLMEYILIHYPEVLEPTQEAVARVYNTSGQFHDVENTNDAMYAIPNLLGSKTGYTDLAGGNLTIAFDAGFDRPVIITVLGSTYEERFTDVLTLVAAVKESMK